MSAEASPSGRPVNPPMPNMGMNARANFIGAVNRIEPPHSERIKAVRMMIDGTEIIIVVNWKKELITVPMPVKNIWCAHTINDIKPMNNAA